MSTSLLDIIIYLLGFVGLAAIGLLLLRSWQVLRSIFVSRNSQRGVNPPAVFSVVLTVAALWINVRIAIHIFSCLTENYCGPNIASGWIYLAMLGVVYLIFEVIIFVMKKIGRV